MPHHSSSIVRLLPGRRTKARAAALALGLGLALAGVGYGPVAHAEPLTDEQVMTLVNYARDNITLAVYEDGSNAAPETEAERAKELLPVEDARRVIEGGFSSGILQWCGLDWQVSMSAVLTQERDSHMWGEKQLAFINLLHGIAMVHYVEIISANNNVCSDEVRAEAEKALAEMKGQ